mmetsp:Transcript_32259/g.74103  ORF Transcript_32259/g.74103 Transcript_32259/m.74103 type:complete len:210 (-) Transcript_32259:177-806(-)
MEQIDQEEKGIQLDTKERPAEWTEEQEKDASAYVQDTLEESLRQAYESLEEDVIMPLHVQFHIEPISWQLEHIFVVPVLTRKAVQKDPSLQGTYRKMEETFQANGDFGEIRSMAERLVEQTQNAEGRTLLADLSILCRERFTIKRKQSDDDENDGSSGKLLVQGSTGDHQATHLVRFEMEMKHDDNGNKVPGDWQIIDWDDMLEGNVWH